HAERQVRGDGHARAEGAVAARPPRDAGGQVAVLEVNGAAREGDQVPEGDERHVGRSQDADLRTRLDVDDYGDRAPLAAAVGGLGRDRLIAEAERRVKRRSRTEQ